MFLDAFAFRLSRRLMMLLVILGMTGLAAQAQTVYHEVPDVPTDLPASGSTFLPWDVVENNGGIYSLSAALPPFTSVDALHLLATGEWLLSVEAPTDLGGASRDPRDVFLWDGASLYSSFAPYGGAVAQIPEGANVDAVFLDQTGSVIVSFDVPTTIGSITYQPSDLVRYDGLMFDPIPLSFPGIPSSSNVTAADRRGLLSIFSVDVPTTVGFSTFLPGELISWNGVFLNVFDPQSGWPATRSSRINALTFQPSFPAPGANPGDTDPLITLERLGPAQLRIRWPVSTCEGGEDAGVYQGTLGAWYSHTLIDCSDTFPYLQEDIPLPEGDAYFLVVPHNGAFGEEGSYGLDNVGDVMTQRPRGAATCVPAQVLGCP